MPEEKTKFSWFWKWFLNNKIVAGLLILLLLLLNIIAFTKISYLFEPVLQFFAIVGLPLIISGIMYYFLVPLVDFMEKKGIKRIYGIFILFLIILSLLIWGGIVAVPKIQEQTLSFVNNVPFYIDRISHQLDQIASSNWVKDFQPRMEEIIQETLRSLTQVLKEVSKGTLHSIGNIVGYVANIVLVIVTTPFILFYLLKDGKDLPKYMVQFLPNRWRNTTLRVLADMNEKVSQYIRGQLTVAFAVAVMFIIGFSLIGLEYAVTIGVLAGFLNLIPYLGSFLAMVPAVFLALAVGPVMVLKVGIVFIIEQTIEGRFVSPLVLGSQLDIHPVTIIFVLLTSGKIFGIVGVILGIPAYAAVKVLLTYIFRWYKSVSSLYEKTTYDSFIQHVEKRKKEQ